jgi:negative regulator of genetic competence, sporulation and motility
MELLRITDKKLKVTLTEEDMERYQLDRDTMDYDTTETRSAFWQILDEAKHKTGFDACGSRIFVQIYASRDGGCEMYVTIAEEEGRGRRRGEGQVRGGESLYRFDSLDTLLTVCRKLSELGYAEKSAAYTEGGAYYLLIRERLESSIMSPKAVGEFSFIEEYGDRLPGSLSLFRLREHGECLSEDGAVERFSTL